VIRGLALVVLFAARLDASPPVIDVVATTPVLEILDPSGSVERAGVEAAVGKLALAHCASDAQWTGDAFAWIVTDWHGKVTKLELAVDKPAVETCLAAELKQLVIPRAQGRATIFARLHLAHALVSTAKPDPTPPPVKRGEVRVTRVVAGKAFADPDRVRAALTAQLQDVTICYEQALEKKPRLAGPSAIELSVTATGVIDSAAVGTAPGDMASCVKGAMLRMRLPAPAAADKVQLTLQLGPEK